MISVIIPTYNCSKYIVKCIKSLIFQTLLPFEIIIVDDGSQDRTQKEISDFISNKVNINPLIKVIHNLRNLGSNPSRNKGFEYIHPNSEYVIFCDSDAIYYQNFLEKLNKLQKHTMLSETLTNTK